MNVRELLQVPADHEQVKELVVHVGKRSTRAPVMGWVMVKRKCVFCPARTNRGSVVTLTT